MPTTNLVLIGAGGHCSAVVDIVERSTDFHILGVLDPGHVAGTVHKRLLVLGSDDEIEQLTQAGNSMLITVGQIKSAKTRQDIAAKLLHLGTICPTICCPSAVIARSARIGAGTVIFPHAVIGAHVVIGEHCIINSGSIVEHDTCVENFCHVSTGAIINGGCFIGEGSFIGSQATLREGVKVGADCLVGACSFVNRDIQMGQRVAGTPCRQLKTS